MKEKFQHQVLNELTQLRNLGIEASYRLNVTRDSIVSGDGDVKAEGNEIKNL